MADEQKSKVQQRRTTGNVPAMRLNVDQWYFEVAGTGHFASVDGILADPHSAVLFVTLCWARKPNQAYTLKYFNILIFCVYCAVKWH